MNKKEIKEKTNDLISNLLKLVGITADVSVSVREEDDSFAVDASISNCEEAGLVIGSRGATLGALQSFVSMALRQGADTWIPVSIDIDGWREKQEQYLVDLSNQAIERAQATGDPQHLYNLSPSQRRIIHTHIGNAKGIISESHGEGDNRYLVVKADK